ncbi:hypothetical protein [Jatrophihabitans lederbergiae]|uniref:Uncharacterized protein n=1 Tax=Jatrophihabitans lederbergiae TaxID=3075547 RepID=A0ABU2JC02_9ACTN|nr:hypothetical protein [Jatrophihabitans sp. DSM 44399]MDT0262514.1 hypothetical protein [Jatrophihabitans sp. DSM 44399]
MSMFPARRLDTRPPRVGELFQRPDGQWEEARPRQSPTGDTWPTDGD